MGVVRIGLTILATLAPMAGPPLVAARNQDSPIGEAGAREVAVQSEKAEVEGTGPADETEIRHDGIRGVIVDDTMTFIGRQFYDAFAIAWLDQGVGDDYSLSIHEQPTAASGSRVWVEHDRRKLFEVFLAPIRANIVTRATAAAGIVAERFRVMELEKARYTDPDLAPDEF